MKINYIFFKRLLIAAMLLVSCYALFFLIKSFALKPTNLEFKFLPLTNSTISFSSSEEQPSEFTSSKDFNYKIKGYRANSSQASVIVEKNNQTFVVQQGALLENKYKLLSVDGDYATFEHNGTLLKLSTKLILGN